MSYDFSEKADTCFDSCWTSVLAVSFGDEKVSLILLLLLVLFRKSIGNTDSSTAKHRGYTIPVANVTDIKAMILSAFSNIVSHRAS